MSKKSPNSTDYAEVCLLKYYGHGRSYDDYNETEWNFIKSESFAWEKITWQEKHHLQRYIQKYNVKHSEEEQYVMLVKPTKEESTTSMSPVGCIKELLKQEEKLRLLDSKKEAERKLKLEQSRQERKKKQLLKLKKELGEI